MKSFIAIGALTLGSFAVAAPSLFESEENSSCSAMEPAIAANPDIIDTAVSAGSFKTLAAALEAADLIGALKGDGPFTVFAPTDDAFAKLPKGTVAELLKPENRAMLTSILTYHVVPGKVPASKVVRMNNAATLNGQRVDIMAKGGKVKIDKATVVKADIVCSNGVIHVIDQVILPESRTIVDLASEAGTFNTLLAAAKAAGLADLLGSEGPFTVFAPTDEAFAKLPAGTVDSLLLPENRRQLADILKYHVVPGRIFARDAVTAERAATALGDEVTISIADGRLKVNDAAIVATDIETSNGVVHVIDRVILPAS